MPALAQEHRLSKLHRVIDHRPATVDADTFEHRAQSGVIASGGEHLRQYPQRLPGPDVVRLLTQGRGSLDRLVPATERDQRDLLLREQHPLDLPVPATARQLKAAREQRLALGESPFRHLVVGEVVVAACGRVTEILGQSDLGRILEQGV